MKIIIKIKDTATLSRIEELGNALQQQKFDSEVGQFPDVIESIDTEW